MKKGLFYALMIMLVLSCVVFIACNSGDANGETTGEITENTPSTDAPGTDAPGTDAPGTDAPGTDAPDTDAPGTDDPGTDAPGTDAPEVPAEPDPVKITIDGVSITEYKIVYPNDAAEIAAYSEAEAEVKAAEAEVAAADAAVKAATDEDAKKAAEATLAGAKSKLNAANAKLQAAKHAWDVKIFAKESAEFLAERILKINKEEVTVVCETEAASEYEIVVGVTGRGEAPACPEYYSYKVVADGKKIFVNGYDNYAVDNAVYALANAMNENDGANAASALALEYTLPEYTEYMDDIEKLYMRWVKEWEPIAGMLDFEGKKQAYINPGDRFLTCAHRADAAYYPENSIESVISFYRMGGDAVEIDIAVTKDGVLILMHDDTLSRMTNSSAFLGKTIDGITFPKTHNVSDWTYEQIQYLNLKEGRGGSSAALTPFKVPTFVEILKTCKNRIFVLTDKAARWRYADVEGIQSSNPNYFLYDAMVEANNFDSVILSYGYLRVEEAVALQKWIYEKTGVAPYIMIRENSGPTTVYKMLKKLAMPNTYAVQINGSYLPATFPTKYKSDYEYLKGKCLFYSWTIVDGNYPNADDSPECWETMYGIGYRMAMTNRYLDLVKFAAEKYKKTLEQ